MSERDPYRQALDWIYSFSDTERTGNFVHDREDNLARERALLARLGNPQRAYGVTHIAGTKGKGSTSALLDAILRAAGIRTGLYTQPDLHTFRERIRVDGQVISGDEIARLVPELRRAVAETGSTYGNYITYEIATALAFLAFREAGVRHAVIEVGLGGRLDATNVVEPLTTAITSISYDHMQVLGSTLGAIAREKAGIIKPGVPVVTSAQAPEALEVLTRIAAERDAPLQRVGPENSGADYRYTPGAASPTGQAFTLTTPAGHYEHLQLALLGEHQVENASVAIALAELLCAQGLPLDEGAIRRGLREARWPARLQVVGHEPWIVIDGAHNADSFARMFAALRRHFAFGRLRLVLALMADKDLPGIATEIARAGVSRVFATAVANPRAALPGAIAHALAEADPALPVTTSANVPTALDAALRDAGPDDLVCVAGSLYLAGEALRWCATRQTPEAANIEIAGIDH